MGNLKSAFLSFCLFLCFAKIEAQDKLNIKFGKITVADFNLAADKFDSGANAVIIADIGNTSFEGNDKGFFNTVFTRFLRVKIVNNNGFKIGSREIFLYTDTGGVYEKIISLKGSTFNLENGIIAETKLDEKSINKERYNKDYEVRKFSMPALKVGAIFDLVYTIKSPFPKQIRSWSFQGDYPSLWSEYEVIIPSVFHFVLKIQGDEKFDVKTAKEIPVVYSIRRDHGIAETGLSSLNTNSADLRWVKKNVPSLHEEPFTTTLKNYYSRVSFQLNYFQWSNEDEKYEFLTDWKSTSKSLLEEEDFGLVLMKENYWMSNDLKTVIAGSITEDEKIYNIFTYVRDNFSAIGKNGYSKNSLFVNSSSLKEVFKKKEGNVAEINLLLTAMLRKAGIRADPLILSTRDNGIANAGYPLINEYNYVICVAYSGDKTITLDASQSSNGYGQLPIHCYNGWGHLMNPENPTAIIFSADSLKEISVTNTLIINDDNGKPSGSSKIIFGKVESDNVRREIIGSSLQSYEKKIRTEYGTELFLENFEIDSLDKFDFPIAISCDFSVKSLSSGEILYFDPMIGDRYKSNPFMAMERHYPVELPYRIDDTYLLNMDIPAGYQVDELPKSARVNYNGDEGRFEYMIQAGKTSLQLSVHLKVNKAVFPVEEYATLRDFFSTVVKKENEKIVFKKKH